MSIIDRRANPKDKSLSNRQRFIKRAKEQVKKAVGAAITNTNIKDFSKGVVKVPIKGIYEPTFEHDGNTGSRRIVVPGNKKYVEGDSIPKPVGDGKGSGNDPSTDGDGEDDFEFALTQDEFIDFFFDDLELPNLVKKQMKEMQKMLPKRAGFTSSGNPANLSIANTVKKSIGRKLALRRPKQTDIDDLEKQISEQLDPSLKASLTEQLQKLKNRQRGIPYVDKIDLQYRNFIPQPQPTTQAVMICLMDVSGSMGEREKDIAKRFFLLLYILLHKKYQKVEVAFVRHHHEAEECSEHDFFYKRESGGTVVSNGVKLVNEIADRYPSSDWNIYVSQASDGDNDSSDEEQCRSQLNALFPKTQYYTYLDIPTEYSRNRIYDTQMWKTFEAISGTHDNVAIAKAYDQSDIWSVFQDLFSSSK